MPAKLSYVFGECISYSTVVGYVHKWGSEDQGMSYTIATRFEESSDGETRPPYDQFDDSAPAR